MTNIVSRPAGLLRILVPPSNSDVLVSFPFDAFDPDINVLFSNQLTGATNEIQADAIFKWDAGLQVYSNAYKAANTGNSAHDGKWFVDFTNWSTSTLAFYPGEGFWVRNVQSSTQTFFLSGTLVLDDVFTNSLYEGGNLMGYPYAAQIALSNTDLTTNDGAYASWWDEEADVVQSWNGTAYDTCFYFSNQGVWGELGFDWIWCCWLDGWPVPATNELQIGHGYWYYRRPVSTLDWSEVRPYQNLFPVNTNAPEVTAMTFNGNKDEVTLTIRTTGETGEKIDVYYKDVDATSSFVSTGWLIAATNLASSGQQAITWTDAGSASRGKINTVFSRYYLLGRVNVDSDGDGLPDSAETFVYNTDTNNPDSDNDGLSDGAEVYTYGTDPLNSDTDGDGMSDGMEVSKGRNPLVDDNYSTLPFVETFETLTNGPINGQNGWTCSSTSKGQVSTNSAYQSTNALQILASLPVPSVEHLFGGVGVTNVWTGFRSKLVRRQDGSPAVSSDATAAFFVDSSGRLTVYNGSTTNWLTLTNHPAISTSSWSHIVVNQDFLNQKWALWLDGTQVVSNVGFANVIGEFSIARFMGARYGVTYVDHLIVAGTGDADGDGMPDDWEVLHELNPTSNDASADQDGDGLSNLGEYQNGSDPRNSDTDGDGMSDGDEVNLGRDPCTPGTVPDTSGTLVGLKVFTVLE